MPIDPERVPALAAEYAARPPRELVELAVREHGAELILSFSGAEDVVLLDMAARAGGAFRALSLDTGRLHAETYRFLQQVRDRYRITLEVVSPEAAAVERLVREKGLFSFYEDGHAECCRIRKVEPLGRALRALGARAWMTGQRRDQSPDTRAELPVIQLDAAHGAPGHPLIKLNPLAGWTSQQVWAYIREHDVPYNALHERGFVSIGCEPCTRAILPGQHEREGRWWWEEATHKECGLHTARAAALRARAAGGGDGGGGAAGA